MSEHRLRADQVSVGSPLPFGACDERGVPLLRRGSIIASQAQLDRLLENGLYGEDPQARSPRLRNSGYVPVLTARSPGVGDRLARAGARGRRRPL